MPQKPRRTTPTNPTPKRRPVQDVAMVKKQANQFPAVGMTLRSYKYDPRDTSKFSPGQGVVVNKSRFQKLREKITLKRVALVLGVIVLLVGGFLGYKFIHNTQKLFGGNIFDALKTTKLKGEDQGRVNILLAGNSSDDAGHNGANLTDSIMVISIDTKNHKAFLMSIPRDLWVGIGDDGHAKINEAYVDGEASGFSASGYPNGGMGQLEQVVSENLGITINYYALVNYQALKQAVDAVGGVDFTVASKDPRGLYDPNIDWTTKGPLVKLSNGVHHLSGQQALDLARARGDAYNSYGFPQSDFDRTEHQRQLLVALKSKAVSAGTLSNPAKLSSLSDAIGNNVKTDFKLPEVHRLYDLSKLIQNQNVTSLGLNNADGSSLLKSYSSPSGQSALIPEAGLDDFSDIQMYLKRQMSSDPVVQEGAKVVVLNATEATGLASSQKTLLANKNVIVSKTGDADTDQATTTIIDNSAGKKPSTRSLLIKQYGSNVTTTNPYADRYEADFIILLGANTAASAAKTNQ